MNDSAQIIATVIRDPIRTVWELGGDVQAVCAEAAIDPAMIADAPPAETGSVPLRHFVALNQIAAARLHAPHFGRVVGAGFNLGNLGDVGRAALAAPSLGAALRLMERAFLAVQGETELRLAVADGTATLSYRILDPDIWPRDQDAELTIGVFTALVACVAGPGWRPLALGFEHMARGADQRRGGTLRCPVTYGALVNSLTFEATLLDQPMPQRDHARYRSLSGALNMTVHRLECAGSVALRARQQILRQIGAGPVDQTSVARELCMSRRGLRRHLAEEGTSFHDLLGTCRDSVAMRLLQTSRLSVAEIADWLGYSEASGFERAFRRRTGETPAGYRRAHGPQD